VAGGEGAGKEAEGAGARAGAGVEERLARKVGLRLGGAGAGAEGVAIGLAGKETLIGAEGGAGAA